MVPRPIRALGQNRGNAIEDPQKIEYRLISAKPDLLYPGAAQAVFGKSGRGQRRGKSNGISAPDQMEGQSATPWMASQQQQTSSLQAGQSTAEGASRHSPGAQSQSAQRITNLAVMVAATSLRLIRLPSDWKRRFGQASPRMACADSGKARLRGARGLGTRRGPLSPAWRR